MKKAANFLACEQAQLGVEKSWRGATTASRREEQDKKKETCHFSSLIHQLALAVPLENFFFPKSGRVQTYVYLESIYDSLHGSLYVVHCVTRK